MKTNDGLNMRERMQKILNDDNYLNNLLQTDFKSRKKYDLLFEKKKNILSFIKYYETGTDLSVEWQEFIQDNPFIQEMLPIIKAQFKSRKYSDLNDPDTCYQLGNISFENKDYLRSVELYSRTIEMKEDHAMAYFNRGNAHKTLGNNINAKEDYSKAIRINPELFSFLYEENPVRKKERINFQLKRTQLEEMVGRGSIEQQKRVDKPYNIVVLSPMDEIISKSGRIKFKIKIKAADPEFFKSAHKFKIEIFRTNDNNPLPLKIEITSQKDIITENVDINEDGVFNWYLDIDKERSVYMGMFKVWLQKT